MLLLTTLGIYLGRPRGAFIDQLRGMRARFKERGHLNGPLRRTYVVISQPLFFTENICVNLDGVEQILS